MSPVIGSMGELLVEFVCAEQDTHHGRPAAYQGPFPSGAPGIFIDQAAQMGARTVFLGAVGSDAFGKVVRDRLEASGVGAGLIDTVDGVPTGSAFVAYNSDGSREFVFNIGHSAAACFRTGPAAVEALRAAGVSVFHISGSSLGDPAMARAALEICRALESHGVGISFDPNIRKEMMGDRSYMAVVRGLLDLATWVLPSVEDAELLFPGEVFEDYARRLRNGRARHVVLKRGAQGCSALLAGGRVLTLPAHRVDVVDPTGAGDCFCGTYVALTASGRIDDAAALVRANAAGALAVTKLGPMEGNSRASEIDALLAGEQGRR